MSRRRLAAGTVGALLLALAAGVAWLERPRSLPPPSAASTAPSALLVERGAALARTANCAGCHTAPGGAAMAGGRSIATPFGKVTAPNLTPHPVHGLGGWSADDFWRALHEGRSRDGRLLSPAFPYPSYTQIARDDSDALFAWLRSLPAADAPNAPSALRFPYSLQTAQWLWRARYFTPGPLPPEPARDAVWHRGRYLVEALGHCMACHTGRDRLGGPIAMLGSPTADGRWFSPSLHDGAAAGVADWPLDDIVRLLRDGRNQHAVVSGPMAGVVYGSTQHLGADDLQAMAVYLKALPPAPQRAAAAVEPAPVAQLDLGRRLYATHCASCHGDAGEGAPGLVLPLAGNRSVTMAEPHNLLQNMLRGGFAPATAGNPRPFGMPPFGQVLSDAEIAAIATHLRQSWGHAASAVSPLAVQRAR